MGLMRAIWKMTDTVMMMIYDECQKKIAALEAENRRLKESQENTVKMLKAVLEILDKVMHL